MAGIEETYPAYGPKILKAREAGFSDEEIQAEFQSRIQEASKAGFSVDEIGQELGSNRKEGFSLKGAVDAYKAPARAALGAVKDTGRMLVDLLPSTERVVQAIKEPAERILSGPAAKLEQLSNGSNGSTPPGAKPKIGSVTPVEQKPAGLLDRPIASLLPSTAKVAETIRPVTEGIKEFGRGVQEGANIGLTAASKFLPFPGIMDAAAGKKGDLGELINPLPRAATDALEWTRGKVGHDTFKLIEDLMIGGVLHQGPAALRAARDAATGLRTGGIPRTGKFQGFEEVPDGGFLPGAEAQAVRQGAAQRGVANAQKTAASGAARQLPPPPEVVPEAPVQTPPPAGSAPIAPVPLQVRNGKVVETKAPPAPEAPKPIVVRAHTEGEKTQPETPTSIPPTPRGLSPAEAQQRQTERTAEAEKLTAPTEPLSTEFTKEGDEFGRGAIVHPSTKNPGQWQVSAFDKRGFAYDEQFKTRAEAIEFAQQGGMKPSAKDASKVDQLAKTEEFQKGNEATRVTGFHNELSFRGDNTGALKVHGLYEEKGFDATKEFYEGRLAKLAAAKAAGQKKPYDLGDAEAAEVPKPAPDLWAGTVDAKTGAVTSRYTREQAKAADWHHSNYMSPADLKDVAAGSKRMFYMGEEGKPVFTAEGRDLTPEETAFHEKAFSAAEAPKPAPLNFGDLARAPDGTIGRMRGGSLGSNRTTLVDEQGKRLGYFNRDELKPYTAAEAPKVTPRGGDEPVDTTINRPAAEEQQVVYRVPATGKKKVFSKRGGQWFEKGKTRPVEPSALTEALEVRLQSANREEPAAPEKPKPLKVKKGKIIQDKPTPGISPSPFEAGSAGPATLIIKKGIIESKRPPKDVKAELAEKIEAAIAKAPTRESIDAKIKAINETAPKETYWNSALPKDEREKLVAAHKASRAAWEKESKPKIEKLAAGKVTIKIPGDGEFTIEKTKEALTEILARVKKIDVSKAKDITKGGNKKIPIPKPTGFVSPDVFWNSNRPTHWVEIEPSGDLVKGQKVEIPGYEKLDTWLTVKGENETNYQITEQKTGFKLGDGATSAKKTIDNAAAYLTENKDKIDEAIERQIKKSGKPKPAPITIEGNEELKDQRQIAKNAKAAGEKMKPREEPEGYKSPLREDDPKVSERDFTPEKDFPYKTPDFKEAGRRFQESELDISYASDQELMGLAQIAETPAELDAIKARLTELEEARSGSTNEMDQIGAAVRKRRAELKGEAPPADKNIRGMPNERATPEPDPGTTEPPGGGTNAAEPGFWRRVLRGRGKDKILGRRAIVQDLAKGLDVPIRQGHGRFAQMKAAGFFKVHEEIIRTQKADPLGTSAHEAGHLISKRFLGYNFSHQKPGGRQFDKELVQLGKDLYGDRQPHGGYAEEGIAEFVKYFINDPAYAEKKAPKFFKHFTETMNEDFPDVMATLMRARENYKRFREADPSARILSEMSIGQAGRTHAFHWRDLRTAFLDDAYPMKYFTDQMRKGKELSAGDDPYIGMRLLKGIGGKTETFLEGHTFDFNTLKKTGPSLKEVMEPAAGNYDDLRVYLVARRTLELIGRGKESGITGKDARAAIATQEKNHPEFVKVAKDLHAYNDRVLDYLQKSGVIDADSVNLMRELNKEYVPFFRVMDDDGGGALSGQSGKIANLGQGVRKIKGSGRQIIDPLESIIKNTQALISLAERNSVMSSLVELSRKSEGSGKYVDHIPTPMVPVTIKRTELEEIIRKHARFTEKTEFQTKKTELTREIGVDGSTTEKVTGKGIVAASEKVIREALKNRGFSDGEASLFIGRLSSAKNETQINSVIEKIITQEQIKTVTRELELDIPDRITEIFRPMHNAPHGENIVTHWEKGRKEFYQLIDSELYRAVTAMDKQGATWLTALLGSDKTHERIIGHTIAGPARTLRLGATTLSTEFPLRNPVRDQLTAWLNSKSGYNPIVDFPKGLFHVASHYLREDGDAMYDAWRKAGGSQASAVSMDREGLQKGLEQIAESGTWRGIRKHMILHPIDSWRIISELGEEPTRIGEFARTLKKKGVTLETASRSDLEEGAFNSRNVTVDFNKAGAKMRAMAQMTSFFNAKIQGIDQMAAAFKHHPKSFLAKAAIGLTLPSIYLYLAYRDDPRYQEIPAWQKAAFWIVPTGDMDTETWKGMSAGEKEEFNRQHTVYRIIKPFELGTLFATLPVAALDYAFRGDDKSLADLRRDFMPDYTEALPTLIKPLFENFANYSTFRQRRIVSPTLEKVEGRQQYNPFTTETAKAAGNVINYSPAKIENLVQGWGGGFGKTLLQGSDKLADFLGGSNRPAQPAERISETPAIRAFVARFPDTQAESIEKFYDMLDEATEKSQTFRAIRREGRREEAQDYRKENIEAIRSLSRLSEVAAGLNDLRHRIDKVRGDKDKDPEDKRREMDRITFQMIERARRATRRDSQPERTLEDLGLR
jgi:hypothetical protein